MGNLKKLHFERVGKRFGAVVLALSVIAAPLAVASTAQAAPLVPVDPPVTVAFDAPECAGGVEDDLRDAAGPVENLLSVFGARLDAYNSGTIVPLYDAYGSNETEFDGGGYPPVCGVRYDSATGAPISEWMYCTDYFSYVCSGVNENGDLVDKNGVVLPPMTDVGSNPKLSDPDSEKMIVALINGMWPYTGVGSFNAYPDVKTARADGSTAERINLQVLVWCLTDFPDPESITDPILRASEQDRADTCAASMGADMQAALLAAVPDEPVFTLAAQTPSTGLTVGTAATFAVNTNILNRAIELTLAGPATNLTVASGPGTLVGTTLYVTGDAPVILFVTGTGAGEISLSGEVEAVKAEHLAWHQSQRTDNLRACQVFSTMFGIPEQFTGSGVASFVATPAGPGKGTGNELAATGASAPGIVLGASGLLLVLGAAILVAQRKRRVN